MKTAKAYLAALAAVLGALTPLLPALWAQWAGAAIVVLAALGITYRVPNAPDPASQVLDTAGPVTHAATGTLSRVLDAVPALLGGGGAKAAPSGEGAENP